MAWSPELREKYAANRAAKIRQGLTNPHSNRQVRIRKNLQERLHPVLERSSLDELFRMHEESPLVTRRNAMKYVRFLCDKHPKLDQMAVVWDGMGEMRQAKTTLEDLCAKVELSIPEFLSYVVPHAWTMGHQLAKLQVGLAQPELVKVSIKAAKDKKNGFKDRKMLLEAGGIAPVAKGIQIAVNQTNVTQGMPTFDDQTIDLADAVRGADADES